ncbi:MAG TPA: DUF1643 domain-containing protein [Ruminiclostridium sp.]|nr:DUF1643 domain-containing protein [Ruminiclostridium sp.]
MIKGAIIDETGKYRYQLWRIWDETKPLVLFIMLNPSTADTEEDDPTIRRCMNYARSWDYGGIKVVNLFAYRATNPKELTKVIDPVGIENNKFITMAVQETGTVIAAWGTKGNYLSRQNHLMELELLYNLHYLELTKDGFPKHPLYLKADLKPIKWAI